MSVYNLEGGVEMLKEGGFLPSLSFMKGDTVKEALPMVGCWSFPFAVASWQTDSSS